MLAHTRYLADYLTIAYGIGLIFLGVIGISVVVLIRLWLKGRKKK